MENRIIDMIVFFSNSFLSYLGEGYQGLSDSFFRDKLSKEFKSVGDTIDQLLRTKLIFCANSVAEMIKNKSCIDLNETDKKLTNYFNSEVNMIRMTS